MHKKDAVHSLGRCSFSTSVLKDKWQAVVSELSEWIHYPYCQTQRKLPLSCLALFQPCSFTYFSDVHRCKWALNCWNWYPKSPRLSMTLTTGNPGTQRFVSEEGFPFESSGGVRVNLQIHKSAMLSLTNNDATAGGGKQMHRVFPCARIPPKTTFFENARYQI